VGQSWVLGWPSTDTTSRQETAVSNVFHITVSESASKPPDYDLPFADNLYMTAKQRGTGSLQFSLQKKNLNSPHEYFDYLRSSRAVKKLKFPL